MADTHHFLIVDDDPVFAAVAESVLLSIGEHRVSTACDGEEGRVCLQRADPPIDVIILDLNMPKLDGMAYMRALSETGFGGHVFVSSGESDAIVQAARSLGAMLGISVPGTLKKPIKRDAVLALLERCRTAKPIRLAGEADLIADTDGSTLVPFYQPQFNILTGHVVGLEALIRIETRDGRLFGPSTLFDRIRNTSQLKAVTVDIAAKVLEDVQRWRARGTKRRISINMDAQVVEDPEILPKLVELVTSRDVDPGSIIFELTETALPTSMSRLIEVIIRLRMIGFGVSIDDYGTGTSNYGLLRLCPFSELKIDRSIVQSAVTDSVARRFLQAAVSMAADLGMEVVAEGVETLEELDLVRCAGIDVVQGFIFCKPVRDDVAFQLADLSAQDLRLPMEPLQGHRAALGNLRPAT